MIDLIETNALTKRYGAKIAVNHVSLRVKKGDIYGLIGKNGAGKTTLMKLILGLANPNFGVVRLFGSDDLNGGRRRIGSLIEAPALYKNESAFENMKRFSILAPTPDEEIGRILELVGLGYVGKKKAGEFSLGMRQRLGIALALLGQPEVLILDEPTNGLDPSGIKEIRDIILRLNASGVTFVISSHLLDELGKIATNYGIMANGWLVEEISATELAEKWRSGLSLTVSDAEAAAAILERTHGGMKTQRQGNTLHILTEVDDPSVLIEELVHGRIRIYEARNESRAFEDFFIERLGR